MTLIQHPSICRSLLIPSTASFSAFYVEQEQALHGYVRSMLPDRHETSEVMQEVIVTLWQKFEGAVDFRH